MLKAILERNPGLDPASIQDVAVGTVLSELGGSKAARMALNHIGYPNSTTLYTVNRACASSLQAITNVADSIAVGRINVGIGCGMESMTRNYGSKALPTVLWPVLRESPVKDARDCILPMGLTSENVSERFGVDRADQDAFGASSHAKAFKAQEEGRFDGEIVPVAIEDTVISKDDGIRQDVTTEAMARLNPVFKPDGASTAGNSSQISDGAAAALLMKRSTAEALGLGNQIMGKWVASQVAGVAPDEMGIGPVIAIPALLAATGIRLDDVGIWEINEAFASQALYSIRKLDLDVGKVNPNGGGIALGHPLGATGARLLASLLPELRRQGQELGVISMCIGTGMGMASLFVRE